MSEVADPFFREKRRWSRVKDGILSYYIEPYLNKVQKMHRPIWLVDTFAGPGRFGDGEDGSPLIITRKAEQVVPGRYKAFFANIKEDQHQQLESNLEPFEDANAYHMRAQEVLELLNERIREQTLFLYLDPYGLEECNFDLVKPSLDRTLLGYSTELLFVLQMPILHREAARDRVQQEANHLKSKGVDLHGEEPYDAAIAQLSPEFQNKVRNVDRLMGGTYWRPIEYGEGGTGDRETQVVTAYLERLSRPDKHAVFCPVESDFQGETKYYICFVSRSDHALILMNEAMLDSRDAYYGARAEEMMRESAPLFANEPSPWQMRKERNKDLLRHLIPEYVARQPGLTRGQFWLELLKDHFMRFSQKDYRKLTQIIYKAGGLEARRGEAGTAPSKLNDYDRLYPPGGAPRAFPIDS